MNIDPLFADLQDIITGIIPLVALAIWVLSQVLGQEKRSERQQAERNRQEIPRAERAEQPGPAGAQQPERSLREEIELFLKQAAAQREQQPGGATTEQQRNMDQVRESEAIAENKQRERRDRKNRQRREQEAADQREVYGTPEPRYAASRTAEARPVELLDNPVIIDEGRPARAVGTQVRPTVSTRQIQEHVSHLGEAVGQADEKMEERLRSTFEHEVGRLGGTTSTIQDVQSVRPVGRAEAPPAPVSAGQIRDMFRNPSDIRRAIIMKEILDRPDWS